jgi:uncharacterized protein YkwD
MKKKFYIVFFSIIFLANAIIFFWPELSKLYLKSSIELPKIEESITNQIHSLTNSQKIFNPPPLKINIELPLSTLTQAGVIRYTNLARQKNGLPPLKENTKLNSSAELKAEDMFTEQYFAHQSPDNVGITDLVKEVNYQFVAIGENLALGNFQDDQALVDAWMNSPEHRENILNTKYTEIGVAVLKGTYEGEKTWMAVQHFGEPLSACPSVDQNLKTTIDANNVKLKKMLAQIETLKTQLPQGQGTQKKEEIENILAEYNTLVDQYNSLVDQNKKLVDRYNQEASLFNNCLNK